MKEDLAVQFMKWSTTFIACSFALVFVVGGVAISALIIRWTLIELRSRRNR